MARRGNRDVELVIRARNEASKALGAVSSALDELTASQRKVSTGSTETSTMLSRLGATLTQLNTQVRGVNTFDRLASGMQKATTTVAKLEQELDSLTASQARTTSQISRTENAVGHLDAAHTRLTGTLAKQKAETGAAQKNFNDLTKSVNKAEKDMAKGQSTMARLGQQMATNAPTIERLRARYRDLASEILNTEKPSDGLVQAFRGVRKELTDKARAMEKARTSYADNRQRVDQLKASLTGLRTELSSADGAFQRTSTAQDKTAASLQRVDTRLKNTRSDLNALKGAAESGAAGVTQLQTRLASARTELQAVAGTTAQAEAAMSQLGTRIRQGLLRSLSDAQKQLKDYQVAWQQTQATIRSAAQQGRSPDTDPAMAGQIQFARQLKGAVDQTRVAIHEMRTAIRGAGNDVRLLGPAQTVVSNATARLQTTTANLSQTQARLAQTSQQVAAAQDRKAAATERANAALARQAHQGRAAMTWLQRLRGELIAVTLAYTGLYGAIQQLSEATRVFQAIEAAQSRMAVGFGGNTAVVARELSWVRSEANRLGIEIGVLAEEYSKLSVATYGTAMEGEETRRIFTAVAEAARVNKLSIDQVQGTFLALTQMVSKGAVSMEELRRQLGDRLYGAFILAARSMNITTAELDKLVSTGQLASTEFLPKFARELEKTFGPQLAASLETLTTQIGIFQNTKFSAREVFNEGGWIEGLRDALKTLNEYMTSEQGKSFFYNLGSAAGAFVKILAEVPAVLDEIIIVLAVLAGVKTFNALGAAAQGMASRFAVATAGARASSVALDGTTRSAAGSSAALGTLGTTAGAVGHRLNVLARWVRISTVNMTFAERAAWGLGRALGVLRGVMAALGGIPGILVAGLSAAFGYWLTSTKDVISATGDHQQQMYAVLEAYDKAADKAGDWAKAVEGVSAAQIAKTVGDLRSQLEREINAFTGAMEVDGLGRLRLARGDWGDAGQEIFEMFRALERGETTVAKVRQRLDEMVKASEGIAPEIRKAIENQAELLASAETTERAFADQVTIAEEMGISVDGVSEAVRSLQRTIAELNDESTSDIDEVALAAEKMRKAVEETEGAIGKLTEMVPELAREWKYLETLKGIDEIFNAAIATAEMNGLTEAVERLKRARDAARLNAATSQVSGSLVDRIVGVESSGDANARNPNSTATGLGQFIESTWLRMFRQYFPDRAESMSREAILALRTEATVSRQMVELYARENAKVLQDAGLAVSDASLYLSHFLGPGGAVSVLSAAPSTPLADILSEQVIKANESILRGQTAGGLQSWAAGKVGTSDQELAAQNAVWEIEKKRVEEAEKLVERQGEFNLRLRENAELEAERAAGGKIRTLEQEQQLAIQKAENDARRAGVELEDSTRQAILESVQLKYEQAQLERDIAAEKKAQEDAEKRINLLQQHRRDLMEAMALAQQTGNTEQFGILKVQLKEIEGQLRTAIDAQIAFWEAAMGGEDGEKAAAAIQSLQNLKNSLLETELTAWPTAQAIGSVFGSGLIRSANGFLDKIKETGDVIGSLREAFMQFAADFLLEIAKMIMQQIILNALQAGLSGAFGGGATSGASGASSGGGGGTSAGVSHSGGIAGSANRTRKVSPAWFTNAVRYHGGGMAGLKSNEVPAILERGETIRTKEQERALNERMSSGGGTSTPQPIKIINQIDSGEMVAEGIGSVAGEKAFVNAIGKNRDTIKRMLG